MSVKLLWQKLVHYCKVYRLYFCLTKYQRHSEQKFSQKTSCAGGCHNIPCKL